MNVRVPTRRSGRGACLLAVLAAAFVARSAHAHPGPAEPPLFGDPDCITVVDLREQQLFTAAYDVAYDDVELQAGDIAVSDAKTHQFFAFRGEVYPYEGGYAVYPFAAADSVPISLPLWLSIDDVSRAAAAVRPEDMTGFNVIDVPDDSVLAADAALSPLVLEITSASERVPITLQQARKGVKWDLSGVPAGVYKLVSYVWSPPKNDWAARPGVIKLVDAEHDPPAVTLDAVDASVFAGQGRVLRGCVNAPPGSTLTASLRQESTEDLGKAFTPWLEDQPVTGDSYELCFAPPADLAAGLYRMRVSVRAPDGTTVYAYSSDTLSVIGQRATCTPSQEQCCPAGASAGAGSSDDPVLAGSGGSAGATTQPDAGQTQAAGAGASRASGTADAGTSDAADSRPRSPGCSAQGATAPASTPLLALFAWLLVRRRVRARL